MKTNDDLELWKLATRGTALKEEAMNRVERNADDLWKLAASDHLERIARSFREFTADQVWQSLEHDMSSTHEPRALGAIMRKAAINGIIRATPRYIPSIRPECHRRPVMIWESLIYKDAA